MNANLHQGLKEQAANWYARLRAPDCSAADREAFAQWLQADALHQKAFQMVRNTVEQISQQGHHDPRLKALADAALANRSTDGANPSTDGMERNAAAASLTGRVITCVERQWRRAAVVLFTVGVAALLATRMNQQVSEPSVSDSSSYANYESREKRIELADGSIVHLDVNSQLDVNMSGKARRIELNQGRAYFEVAHDSARPFSVAAKGTQTVALGTHFEVAIKRDGVDVTLAEGSVAVSDVVAGRWREVLHPGQRLQIAGTQRELQGVNADAVTSWSKGRLMFDSTPLTQALDEINRYAAIKVSLGDAALANIPIGGNFIAGGDSNEFVAALTAVLPLRSVNAGANEIVLFQKYESATP